MDRWDSRSRSMDRRSSRSFSRGRSVSRSRARSVERGRSRSRSAHRSASRDRSQSRGRSRSRSRSRGRSPSPRNDRAFRQQLRNRRTSGMPQRQQRPWASNRTRPTRSNFRFDDRDSSPEGIGFAKHRKGYKPPRSDSESSLSADWNSDSDGYSTREPRRNSKGSRPSFNGGFANRGRSNGHGRSFSDRSDRRNPREGRGWNDRRNNGRDRGRDQGTERRKRPRVQDSDLDSRRTGRSRSLAKDDFSSSSEADLDGPSKLSKSGKNARGRRTDLDVDDNDDIFASPPAKQQPAEESGTTGKRKSYRVLSNTLIESLQSKRLLVELPSKHAAQLVVTEACRRSLLARPTEHHFVCVLCMDHGTHPAIVEALNGLVHAVIRHDFVLSSNFPHADVFVCSPQLLVWLTNHHRTSMRLLHQLLIVDAQALFFDSKDHALTMRALKTLSGDGLPSLIAMVGRQLVPNEVDDDSTAPRKLFANVKTRLSKLLQEPFENFPAQEAVGSAKHSALAPFDRMVRFYNSFFWSEHDGTSDFAPTVQYSENGSGVICQITFKGDVPHKCRARSTPQASRSKAFFDATRQLYIHLRGISRKKANRDEMHEPLFFKRPVPEKLRITPSANESGTADYFVYAIDFKSFEPDEAGNEQFLPLVGCLAFPAQLPVEPFSAVIYTSENVPLKVSLMPKGTHNVDTPLFEKFKHYHKALMSISLGQDLTKITFDADTKKYFILPFDETSGTIDLASIEELLDGSPEQAKAFNARELLSTDEGKAKLHSCLLASATHLDHYCRLESVREDLHPTMLLSDADSQEFNTKMLYYKAEADDTFSSWYLKRRQLTVDETQPLLDVRKISRRHRSLEVPHTTVKQVRGKGAQVLLVPECWSVIPIRHDFHRVCRQLPAVLYQLERLLIVDDIPSKLKLKLTPEQYDVLDKAMTTERASSDFNYESLEILGDKVIEYVTCLFLFLDDCEATPDDIHWRKRSITMNLNLWKKGVQYGLQQFTFDGKGNAKSWVPPGSEEHPCELQDGKSVADVVESTAAAFFLSGGLSHAREFMAQLELPTPVYLCEKEGLPDPKQYVSQALLDHLEANPTEKAYLLQVVAQAESCLHYRFQHKELAIQALLHPSYIGDSSTASLERLESFGDTVLTLLVLQHAYMRTEGNVPVATLDMLKQEATANEVFAYLAVKTNLHKCLQFRDPQLVSAVTDFIPSCSVGQLQLGNIRSAGDISLAKQLADVFEAIAGAICIEAGLEVTWKVFYRIMQSYLQSLIDESILFDPVKRLKEIFGDGLFQDFVQKKGGNKLQARLFYHHKLMHRGDLQYGRSRATFHAAHQLLSDKSVAELVALKQSTDLELAQRGPQGPLPSVDVVVVEEEATPTEAVEVADGEGDKSLGKTLAAFGAFGGSFVASSSTTSSFSGFAKYQGKSALSALSQQDNSPQPGLSFAASTTTTMAETGHAGKQAMDDQHANDSDAEST